MQRDSVQSTLQEEGEASDLLPIPVSSLPRAAPRLSVVIGVAGWVTCPQDFVGVWQRLGSADCERFALVWETQELIKLNSGIARFVKALVRGWRGRPVVWGDVWGMLGLWWGFEGSEGVLGCDRGSMSRVGGCGAGRSLCPQSVTKALTLAWQNVHVLLGS